MHRSVSHLSARFAAVLFPIPLLVGGRTFVQAAPTAPVDFPAAAGIAPATKMVGPVQNIGLVPYATSLMLILNDLPGDIFSFNGGNTSALVNFSVRNGGSGAETNLNTLDGGPHVVSPIGLTYYFPTRNTGGTNYKWIGQSEHQSPFPKERERDRTLSQIKNRWGDAFVDGTCRHRPQRDDAATLGRFHFLLNA